MNPPLGHDEAHPAEQADIGKRIPAHGDDAGAPSHRSPGSETGQAGSSSTALATSSGAASITFR